MKRSFFVPDNEDIVIRYDLDIKENNKISSSVFHNIILQQYPDLSLLEVSTNSENYLGTKLSAFNLMYDLPNKNIKSSIESLYQGSKVLENGIQHRELYYKSGYSAKMDRRLWKAKISHYNFFGQIFSMDNPTLFYNWIYISALSQKHNRDFLEEIKNYSAFTDIFYNPKNTINCQARSCAIAVSLLNLDLFEKTILDVNKFRDIVYKTEEKVVEVKIEEETMIQGMLF